MLLTSSKVQSSKTIFFSFLAFFTESFYYIMTSIFFCIQRVTSQRTKVQVDVIFALTAQKISVFYHSFLKYGIMNISGYENNKQLETCMRQF